MYCFMNFFCLSQSEASTDNRKVSTFFAFQHVRRRCCYRSYLDRFLSIENDECQERSPKVNFSSDVTLAVDTPSVPQLKPKLNLR